MPRARVRDDVELHHEVLGDPAHPPVLMINGLTAQLISWPDAFVRQLAERGRYVIRFDNRDCGLSTKWDGHRVDARPVLLASMNGGPIPPVPYTLSDMAADAVGLLDHLGIGRAHVVGMSMGGAIAQTLAVERPERVRTLTSIMSTTGEHDVGQPSKEAIAVLLMPPPRERDAYIDAGEQAVIWQSKRYADRELTRARSAAAFDRSFYPEGAPRQLAALYASGSRAEGLRALRTPTLVIHGTDDTLIDISGGRRTAALVPGADLLEVTDMGHDLPAPLFGLLVDAIARHTEREN